jgi:putative DNA primase/helicase
MVSKPSPLAENLTDFNDLAAAHGLDDVRDQIEQAQPVEAPAPAAAACAGA